MKHFLSPRELAKALGVSESTIKRWADDGLIKVRRTAGGHRRVTIADAISFVRKQGIPVEKPDILGVTQTEAQTTGAGYDIVREALVEGEQMRLQNYLIDVYMNGQSLGALFDGPIRQAFSHIGEMWQHQDDGIMIEHRAVDCCLHAINHLRSLIPEADDAAPLAIGGAPAGDPYMLPSVMVATVLADAGWRAVNLGPNTPYQTFNTGLKCLKPSMVWLSLTAPVPGDVSAAIADLGATCRSAQARLIVGGRRASDLTLLTEDAPVDFVSSMESFTALNDTRLVAD